MSILVQLASLAGDVMDKTDPDSEEDFGKHYVTVFMRNFLNVFKK